ncbi:hypothetical protein Riv7116_1946 [Rivularia sp. PCC 7116]|uniref:hypothetical protein n=1 Tax=Rivularia sp. PCC 7116 TaxID=373994 RepID=UPI00029ECC54|nr:hypothetical protein [Rivularia sp. PCC 7116]AFY54485.1 hypothetical protein Riv7116_1946 [Rivularia sp. PCC 7116]
MNKKLIAKVAVGFIVAYTFCYIWIRLGTKRIVHSTGTSGCNYATHFVVPGDSSVISYTINANLALLFTPLRLLELAYWNLAQPVDSPISEEDRKLYKFDTCKTKV